MSSEATGRQPWAFQQELEAGPNWGRLWNPVAVGWLEALGQWGWGEVEGSRNNPCQPRPEPLAWCFLRKENLVLDHQDSSTSW